MTRRNLDTTETAGLVRRALLEAFPGVKFSVRISRYSMGSSVSVRWTDGPTAKAVDKIVYTFKGDYFDGMTDYAGSVYHTLDGEPVQFGGSVSTHRDTSTAADAAMLGAWRAMDKGERYRLADRLEIRGMFERDFDDDGYGWRYVLHAWDFYGKPAQPSPTCARVKLAGDDGYRGNYGTTVPL